MEEMAHRCADNTTCTLCGAPEVCFCLEYTHCPELSDEHKQNAAGCVHCLEAGRFEFWHDTEIGFLDENGLKQVYSHNELPPPNFPTSACIELRRTPQIVTWQQEVWLTHCNDFMTYIGTWEPNDFYLHASEGDGRALFMEMTDRYNDLWDASLPDGASRLESWYATYYVFRCRHCGNLRGNWDCD